MDTQFEIISRLEKKHFVEYYRYIWRKRMIWVTIYGVVALLFLILGLADTNTKWLIYAAVLLLYDIWLFFRPWMVAEKSVKPDTNFEGTETVESVTTFGDVIRDETPHHVAMTYYDKIEKLYIGKNVLVLGDTRKAMFILDKNGFTQGNLEEFLPFIQEKCPQLNLPKW